MKKLFVSLAMLSALVACNKEAVQEEQEQPAGNKQIITATVNTPTKVAYSEVTPGGGAGLTSVWAEGDKFYAIQDGEKVVTFNLVSGAGETTATFTAETEGVTADTQWKAVLGEAADLRLSEIHCGFKGQNGTLASLGRYNYVTAESTGETPSFNFATGTSLSYTLRVKLPAGIKCIEYTPCGYTKVEQSGQTNIYYNSGDENDYSAKNTSTITLASTSNKGDLAYIAIPCLNYSRTLSSFSNNEQYGNLKTGVIITLLNDDSANATKSNGVVVESNLSDKGGIVGTLDLSEIALIDRVKPADAISIEKSGDIQCKLHSSALTQKASHVKTYWSPMNLGASKPSEVGGYFAAGELSSGKSTYTFPSYTLRHQTKSTNRDDLISTDFKIGSSKYGFTFAGSRYDAARVKWGVAWRLPHMIEVYVASNGACTRTTQDGVSGVLFSGTVFIPNSRYMDGDKLNDANTPSANNYTNDNYDCARFWSADQLNRSYSSAGWNEVYTFGNTKDTSTGYDYWRRYRYLGFPIRPVLASSVLE